MVVIRLSIGKDQTNRHSEVLESRLIIIAWVTYTPIEKSAQLNRYPVKRCVNNETVIVCVSSIY